MRTIYNILCFILLVLSFGSAAQNHHRRILHQPFFPTDSFPPIQPPVSSPQSQPKQQQPKLPFSSSSSSSSTQKPFFPSYHSPPPTPSSPTALATFPANISSLLFPQPSSPKTHPIIAVAVSVSLFSAALITALTAFIYYRRHRKYTAAYKASRSDSLRLYPPNTATSDGTETSGHNYKPRGISSASSESLYLGTGAADDITATNSSSAYRKLGSPELKPLPPLPRHNFRQQSNSEDEDEFFSPRGSSSDRRQSPVSSSRRVFQLEVDNFGSRSFNSRTPSYPCSNSASPSNSVSITSSPSLNLKSYSPGDAFAHTMNPQGVLGQGKNSAATSVPVKLPPPLPPPPPPPPPPRFWEIPVEFKYGPLETVGWRPVSSAEPFQDGDKSISDKNEETPKPKLKALHWDKVRASSDRAMVWDQLKPSSFQ